MVRLAPADLKERVSDRIPRSRRIQAPQGNPAHLAHAVAGLVEQHDRGPADLVFFLTPWVEDGMRPACGPIPRRRRPGWRRPGWRRQGEAADRHRQVHRGRRGANWLEGSCEHLQTAVEQGRMDQVRAVVGGELGRAAEPCDSLVFSAPDALDALECRAVLQAGLGQPGVKRLMVGWLRATVACFRQRAARAGARRRTESAPRHLGPVIVTWLLSAPSEDAERARACRLGEGDDLEGGLTSRGGNDGYGGELDVFDDGWPVPQYPG